MKLLVAFILTIEVSEWLIRHYHFPIKYSDSEEYYLIWYLLRRFMGSS